MAAMIRYPADGSILDVGEFDLVAGQRLVVFGPNGSGKSTLLRLLAGILESEAQVEAAYLPQQPHLFRGRAGWNLGLGLGAEEAAYAGQLARKLGLEPVLERHASQLSGGEAQRVALARVLARREPVVLLDEPLAAIDARSRHAVARLIVEGVGNRSAVVVTHSVEEAVSLGTHMAVLIDGSVLQRGDIAGVLNHPVSQEVADAVGVGNLVEGVAHESSDGLTRVAGPIEILGSGTVDEGSVCRAVFGAEAVTLFSSPSPDFGSARNHWSGVIGEIRSVGRLLEVTVACGIDIVALVTPGAADGLGLTVGKEVGVAVKAASVKVL